MKNLLSKYLFEIGVIFIGITISFLFNEWRTGRNQDARDIEIMQSLRIELERNDLFIREIDSSYLSLNEHLEAMISRDSIKRADVIAVAYILLEESSQIRLKEIASFIHGYSSSDQLAILNRNQDILRYLTYMESLLTEHELITNSIAEHASSDLWPLMYEYDLTRDILNYQKDIIEVGIQNESESTIDWKPLLNEDVFVQQMEWHQLRALRLIQINDALHRQVANIIREIDTAIGEV